MIKFLSRLRQKAQELILGGPLSEVAAKLTAAAQTVNALNHALAASHAEAKTEYSEKLSLLGALAMQGGGQASLPYTFLNAVNDSNYRVRVRPSDDKKSMLVTLEAPEEETVA